MLVPPASCSSWPKSWVSGTWGRAAGVTPLAATPSSLLPTPEPQERASGTPIHKGTQESPEAPQAGAAVDSGRNLQSLCPALPLAWGFAASEQALQAHVARTLPRMAILSGSLPVHSLW